VVVASPALLTAFDGMKLQVSKLYDCIRLWWWNFPDLGSKVTQGVLLSELQELQSLPFIWMKKGDFGQLSLRCYWQCFELQEDAFVAHFKDHKGAITSIEWSPHEASTLSVTSADHQLTYELFTPVNYCELPQLLRVHLMYVHSCILQSPTV
jgi:hypothetical protein